MNVNKIFNANVYVDGTSNLLGKAKEIEMPKVTAVTDEHQALGMFGKLSIPTGIELLESKVTWNGFYPDAFERAANPFDAHKIQVKASVEEHGAQGRVSETPLVVLMTVRWKTADLGKFAAATSAEFEEELTVSYIKATLGTRVMLELDVAEQIWIVGGKDLLATYKKNLGL